MKDDLVFMDLGENNLIALDCDFGATKSVRPWIFRGCAVLFTTIDKYGIQVDQPGFPPTVTVAPVGSWEGLLSWLQVAKACGALYVVQDPPPSPKTGFGTSIDKVINTVQAIVSDGYDQRGKPFYPGSRN